MKLSIIIEGSPREIDAIASHFCDGGGEQAVQVLDRKWIEFDYSRCFPGWGYDKKKHGKDLVITGKMVKKEF